MGANVTTRCIRAGVQAVRRGWGLLADPVGTVQAGALLLRGAPSALGWLVGWAATELPPLTLAGNLLTQLSAPSRVGADWAGQHAGDILTGALLESYGRRYRDGVCHPAGTGTGTVTGSGTGHRGGPRAGYRGVLHAARGRRVYAAQTSDIAYGPGGRDHLLDVWRHPDLPLDGRAPVLIQVPGGAWTINDKRGQAYPLMARMVQLGWLCVSINYAKSPRNAWPAHIIDVKRAIAWVRDNIADYGGDPEFITITGGSAGGHLSSLAALTANDPQLQPGFEDADTTVQAAAPFYGVYDLTDQQRMHALMLPFLERFVMQARYADAPALYTAASPISHVHAAAPPFFVLHGRNDAVIPSGQAEQFCGALRDVGAATVGYAELPNAHHAFDTFGTVRTQLAADAVADFLGVTYGARTRTATPTVLRTRATSAG